MIGRLRGTLIRKEPPALLVEVGGVGYELEAPMTTFYDLPAIGEPVTLHTHLVVREDAHLLFGFVRESQRRQFRALLKINGVGPRVALAILSGLTEDELARCIADNDIARLTQVPGIGRKTAERLIVELRDKLPSEPTGNAAFNAAAGAPRDPVGEAVSALIALGYKAPEASRAVRGLANQGLSTEEIIRQALRAMAR
ncbi:MAG: Holliday junction branch migration protein RuvA [Gammaproteobacteria bacterium]|nr:Holliday junction branch migration protein RuvA [Gammaproteobacteria bacterium]